MLKKRSKIRKIHPIKSYEAIAKNSLLNTPCGSIIPGWFFPLALIMEIPSITEMRMHTELQKF